MPLTITIRCDACAMSLTDTYRSHTPREAISVHEGAWLQAGGRADTPAGAQRWLCALCADDHTAR